jgi:hypothetical protein
MQYSLLQTRIQVDGLAASPHAAAVLLEQSADGSKPQGIAPCLVRAALGQLKCLTSPHLACVAILPALLYSLVNRAGDYGGRLFSAISSASSSGAPHADSPTASKQTKAAAANLRQIDVTRSGYVETGVMGFQHKSSRTRRELDATPQQAAQQCEAEQQVDYYKYAPLRRLPELHA